MPNVTLGDSSDKISLRHRRMFINACKRLNTLIKEVREYQPEATFYCTPGSLNLLIGEAHEGWDAHACRENVVLSVSINSLDGGDW